MDAEPLCVLTLEDRAEPECLDRVHGLVGDLWTRVPDVDDEDRQRFEIAVVEVAGNIVEHGGGEVTLGLRLAAYPDRVEASFRDTGRPALVDPAVAVLPDELAEQGRGLVLARTAVDEVSYQRTGAGNRWRVCKLRARRGPPG